jgi:hypothetical protein
MRNAGTQQQAGVAHYTTQDLAWAQAEYDRIIGDKGWEWSDLMIHTSDELIEAARNAFAGLDPTASDYLDVLNKLPTASSAAYGLFQ